MPLPDVLVKKVDDYVDSLAPQIQPRIASELETFQQTTIDSLEEQVINAFRSLFNNDNQSGQGSRGGPSDAPPDAYGGQSLPFANELTQLTRSFGQVSDEAGDNLRDIFNLTDGAGGSEPQARGQGNNDGFSGAKGFLSAAINVVQVQVDNNQGGGGGGQNFQLDGLLAVISDTVKDTARNPEEKARQISPEIKEQVGAKLREQHAPIAEQFTRIALDRLKDWLHLNTSSRDVGDGAKAEIHDQVKDLVKGFGGMFGKKQSNEDASRGIEDRDGEDQGSGGGFSKVVSDKLSTGIAKVHRDVRLEFRKILGDIEKKLFEMLPDQFQRPLEKILGGNPFDSQLDRDAAPNADRGFGDDLKAKLVDKIRGLIRKVQEILRTSILAVVNGGHRKFELASWVFVQNMVEQKVQKYLPKVKITVPDDIGNEGVNVGAPTQNLGEQKTQIPNAQTYNNPPNNNPQGSTNPQSYSNPPSGTSQSQNPQGYGSQPYSGQSYTPQSYNSPQNYNTTQSYNNPQSHSNPQSYDNSQGYSGSQGSNIQQGYDAQQGYNPQPGYSNPPNNNPQSYGSQGYNNSQTYNNPSSYNNQPGYNNPQEYNNRPQYNNPQSYNNQPGYNNPQGYNPQNYNG